MTLMSLALPSTSLISGSTSSMRIVWLSLFLCYNRCGFPYRCPTALFFSLR
jgi:hypothetical protein